MYMRYVGVVFVLFGLDYLIACGVVVVVVVVYMVFNWFEGE